MLLASMNCADCIFDIYDSERVPLGISKNKYYVTPSMVEEIKRWMIFSNIEKIETKSQIEDLISLKLIGEYEVIV